MQRSGSALVVLVAALLLTGGAGAAASDAGLGSLQSGDVETDAVVMQATVDESGDASWIIDYRIRLDDENTTAAFESLQSDIRNNTSDFSGQFATRMRSTVGAAENATGREMAVTNVTVSTRTTIDGQYGIVSYGFQWEGFAATEGDRILVGDALAGLFLDADTKLTFRWPAGYDRQHVAPAPDSESDRSVTWEGPVDFGTDEPRIIVSQPGLVPSWAPYAAGVLILVIAGAFWYYRREQGAGTRDPGAPATGAADAPSDAAGGGSSAAGAGDAANSTATDTTGGPSTAEGGETETASGDGAAGDAERAASGASSTDETPKELLSPEERVLGLLEERGGRMKQKVVTEELGWSAARTSQVVGDLRDAGEVESFRLGRENVLRFPPDDEEDGGSL